MGNLNLSELQEIAGGLFDETELAVIAAAEQIQSTPPAPAPTPEPDDRTRSRADFTQTFEIEASDLWADFDALERIAAAREETHRRMSERFENERIAALAAYQPRSRTDRRGIVWNLLPPDMPAQAGDLIEDAGVWRPQPTISQCTSRYDRAVFVRVEAQRHHDAMLAQYGPDALPTIAAKNRLDAAWQAQRQALRDADDPVIQERDRIDAWRADAGREEYNASRRSTRAEANADLSGMSAEQKEEHRRLKRAEAQRLRRAAKKAAA